MPEITVRGVTRSFGDTTVLEDFDLTIPDRQFIAVVGRSGSGKSTLLRLLAGLDEPDAGEIETTTSLAVAFQEPCLLPWLSVQRNVGLGLTGPDRAERVHRSLTEVGLGDRAKGWPLALSGGQAQRVSLARALVRQPEVVLLDEPFSALDALTRVTAQNLVARLAVEHNWTVVMVTHDVHEALRLADRVIVLGEGVVIGDIEVPGSGPREIGFDGEADLAGTLLRMLGVDRAGNELGAVTASPSGTDAR